MFWRILAGFLGLTLSSAILLISVFRSSSVRYAFSQSPTPLSAPIINNEIIVDYYLPYPGRILPDHFLWPLKAVRDKIWFFLTTDPGRKVELALLFADKRLQAAKILFEKEKPELGFSTLTKAEKYLEQASNLALKAKDGQLASSESVFLVAKAALKHRLVIEEILVIAPEDAKPGIIKSQDYPKSAYKALRDALYALGLPAPRSPFNGD